MCTISMTNIRPGKDSNPYTSRPLLNLKPQSKRALNLEVNLISIQYQIWSMSVQYIVSFWFLCWFLHLIASLIWVYFRGLDTVANLTGFYCKKTTQLWSNHTKTEIAVWTPLIWVSQWQAYCDSLRAESAINDLHLVMLCVNQSQPLMAFTFSSRPVTSA